MARNVAKGNAVVGVQIGSTSSVKHSTKHDHRGEVEVTEIRHPSGVKETIEAFDLNAGHPARPSCTRGKHVTFG
jgi:hypothetical protein